MYFGRRSASMRLRRLTRGCWAVNVKEESRHQEIRMLQALASVSSRKGLGRFAHLCVGLAAVVGEAISGQEYPLSILSDRSVRPT